MHIPEFNYVAPKTISEACSLLSRFKGHVKLMAGGTDLLVSMKQKVKTPEHVIGLKGIPNLNYIKQDECGLSIGPLTRLTDLYRSDVINAHFPLLAQAARSVASPNLRNVGTIGGNICLDTRCCYYNKSDSFRNSIGPCLKFGGSVCHVTKAGKKCFAVSQGDTAPALIALGARVAIQSSSEKRDVAIDKLFRNDGNDYLNLKPEEMITEIQIPKPQQHAGGSYQKLGARKATVFASASAAVLLTVRNGICEDARIVLGSVASCPKRVVKAEEVLRGKNISEDLIDEAAEHAYKDAKPVANILDFPPSYRKEMARVMMIRATREALLSVR